jgi:hypothetical protein
LSGSGFVFLVRRAIGLTIRLALHKTRLRTDIGNSNGGHSKKVLDRLVSLLKQTGAEV